MAENLDYIHEQLRGLAVEIDSLTPDPDNARTHNERNQEALRASLKKFGMRGTIVVQRDGDKLVIRAGNNRVEQAKALGWTHIPALIFEEADREAMAYAIADNRTADLASWDYKALTTQLQSLGDTYELDDLGWSEAETHNLFAAEFTAASVDFDSDGTEFAREPTVTAKSDAPSEEDEVAEESKTTTIVFTAEQREVIQAGLGDGEAFSAGNIAKAFEL